MSTSLILNSIFGLKMGVKTQKARRDVGLRDQNCFENTTFPSKSFTVKHLFS